MNIEDIKLDKDDIYLAFWMRFLSPVIGNDYYKEFIKENRWTQQFFTYDIETKNHLIADSKLLQRIQKFLEFLFYGAWGNLIENILRKWQQKRSNNKAKKLNDNSGTIISDDVLKFHDHDMREKFRILWKKLLNHFKEFMIPSDFGKKTEEQSRQSQTLSGSRFQDIAYKKNEAHQRY